MQLNFSEMFSSFVKENKREWGHDRNESVGASEIFGCLRQVWFRKRGDADKYPIDEDFDEDSWGASERGNILEKYFVVPTLSKHLQDGVLIYAGDNQKTFFLDKNSATPDGLVINLEKDALALYGIPDIESDCICVEIKTIDPRVRLHNEKNIHHGQGQTQLGIIRETTKYKPMYCVILYIDASFLDKLKVFIVKYEENAWTQAKERANIVFEIDDPAEILAEGRIDGTCTYCPFQTSCAIVSTGRVPLVDKGNLTEDELDELDDLVQDYDDFKKLSKVYEVNFKQIQAKIKDKLVELNIRKIPGKKTKRPWSISWFKRAGVKSVNQALIKEALGVDNLDDYKREGDPFDVLKITTNHDDEE